MPQDYSVASEMRDDVEIVTLIAPDGSRAEIAPAWGNNCYLFDTGSPILEEVSFESLRERPTSYGIPILFPFPNRIRDGVFHFRGKQYEVNPNRHGFVRSRRWDADGSGVSPEGGAWLGSTFDAADYPDEILNQFPFPFRVRVTYRLRPGMLSMETELENTGDEDMPYGFGIHPYFTRPQQGTIQIPARKRWELVDSLPTGNRVDVAGQYDLRTPASVGQLELDDIFTELIPDDEGMARCRLVDEEKHLRTTVEFSADAFPEVVVYTTPPPRKAICIEPNSCPTDAFNLANRGIDSHVRVLARGETMQYLIRIGVEPIT